jgi:hypothetical protein
MTYKEILAGLADFLAKALLSAFLRNARPNGSETKKGSNLCRKQADHVGRAEFLQR